MGSNPARGRRWQSATSPSTTTSGSSHAPLLAALLFSYAGIHTAHAAPKRRKPTPAPVEAAEDVRASALTREGEAARERCDHAAAARAYQAAYEAMPLAQQRGEAGAFVVYNAARAYRDAYDVSGSAAELEASQSLLLRFADERAAAGASLPGFVALERDAVDRELAALEAARVAATAATVEPAARKPTPTPIRPTPPPPRIRPTPIEPADLPPPVDDRALRLRNTGGALVAVGGLLVATGAVLLGVGTTFGPAARRDRDDALRSPEYLGADASARQDYDGAVGRYVDESERVGRGFVIAGGSVIAVGAAAIVGGTITLVRARRRARALARSNARLGLRESGSLR